LPERAEIIRIGRDEAKITRPEKVLFRDDGITKRDLVDYYRRIAPWILPHVKAQPLSLERYRDGIQEEPIIQKAVSAYYPSWIKTVTVKKAGGTVRHAILDKPHWLTSLIKPASRCTYGSAGPTSSIFLTRWFSI
jgi:bifunctional non-homologous end joining protein LigD